MRRFVQGGARMPVLASLIGLAWLATESIRAADKPAPRRSESKEVGQEADTAPRSSAGAWISERQFAQCLMIDNRGEIAAAELALEHATSPEVKDFAQKMVKEHGEFLSRLGQFAGVAENADSGDSRREIGSEDVDNPGASPDAVSHDAVASNNGSGMQLLEFKNALGEQSLATLKRELGSKSGAEFDRCYMAQQVGAHLHVLDTLTVLEKHASGEFRDLLMEGKKATEHHLKLARQILKQQESKLASRDKARTRK